MGAQAEASGRTLAGGPDRRRREEDRALKERLGAIDHTILVLSGKGGVGKSTVAVNLAVSLALAGKRVGLLDVDVHGPSIPTLLGLAGVRARPGGDALLPVDGGGLKVMSIAFLLDERDAAVIWRGPRKMGAIRQLLAEVAWGELDVLVVDSPPGTGDEPLSVRQLVEDADGAVLVTTPQEVSLADVRRSVTFCRRLALPVLGVIENMSGFVCPRCGETADIFDSGGGEAMARAMDVPFLGRIPLDPALAHAGDAGTPYVREYAETATAKAFAEAIAPIVALFEHPTQAPETSLPKGDSPMRIAIPLAAGNLAMHFGHCEAFALLDVDPKTETIVKRTDVTPPPHAPGVLPKWLADEGATVILAGGMGSRAQALFAENGIEVVVGAPSDSPETIAQAYLGGTLATGGNVCDH